ncbi:adenylate/guanylate cyclase domain-containing protein [Bradyrhizobium sp.]|uniref:adenylate/guanylate cyclase domain-containing protein n=1 Tax=Bradyrhizobium sp. TaxID=376 RepID=UPI0040383CFF
MWCPTCRHQNRPEAKFCEQCATPLTHDCPRCATPASIAAKFCSECGSALGKATAARFLSPGSYTPKHLAERILTSRDELEGERKQVTVLFSDIKGSMELIADRDPEEAQKILDPILERMMEAVHHYEGMVNRVMGDGVMALFGAPVAHEDHAVRACYAGLRMQERVGQYALDVQRLHALPVTMRVGINSGEIVVSSIGNDLFVDFTVIGQTAHLAARMEQLAMPGSVMATSATYRLVEGYVEAKPLGPVMVKGLGQPVDVFEVTGGGGERTRLQAAVSRGLTRFVGRSIEKEVMRQALTDARAGHGQVVAVVGEPGMGKSRLIHEFLRSDDTAGCLLLQTNSASYGHSASYLPVVELLRNFYFQITDRDNTRSIREKVTSKIMKLDPSLQDIIPPVLDLLDALEAEHPFQLLDPVQHRQYTYQAITRLLLTENLKQPVIAVFEDLHWNDSLTLGLLNELVVGARDARLLLLVSYRPEYRDPWSGRPGYHPLRLEPLPTESVSELLQTLLGTAPDLAPLKNFILGRAGGNPFFVEEIVRALVDTKALQGSRGEYTQIKEFSEIEVPPTVQAVLAARIDTLSSAEKRLLQDAAVIGHDVPFALLHAICGMEENEVRGLLGNLQASEFLYNTQLFPDLQFTFKHSLTHDVAYAGLRHERRREMHDRVVQKMETLYADRIDEQVERLADHALRGHLFEKAVQYLRRAGARATDREAYPEAVVLLEKALEALSHLPDNRARAELAIDLRFDLRNALQPLGDRKRIAEYLLEAEQLADRLGDRRRMGWVKSYLTEQFWMLGRYAESAEAGELALSAARELDDVPLQVVTNLPLGLAHHTRGDYSAANKYFGWNAVELKGNLAGERFGMFVLPSAFARSFIAWGLAETGKFSEAYVIGEEALQISESNRHPFSIGYAHLGLGVVAMRQGHFRRAVRSFQRSLAAGAFADSPVGFAFVALHLGYALSLDNRAGEGIPILEDSIRVAETRGFAARHSLRLAYISEAYLSVDRIDDALSAASRALETARSHQERANEAYALRALGEIDLRRGRPAEAESHFNAALLIARELGLQPLEAHCYRALGETFEEKRRNDEAEAFREKAAALARAMDLRFWGKPLVDSNAAE